MLTPGALRWRLLATVLLLALAVQAVMVAVTLSVQRSQAHRFALDELITHGLTLTRLLDDEAARLAVTARLLASEPALRAENTAAGTDAAAMLAALAARSGIDPVALQWLDRRGRLAQYPPAPAGEAAWLDSAALMALPALGPLQRDRTLLAGEQPLQVAVSAIPGSERALALGRPYDAALARQLGRSSAVGVSWVLLLPDGRALVTGSTLAAREAQALREALSGGTAAGAERTGVQSLDGRDHALRVLKRATLAAPGGQARLLLALHRPLDELTPAFERGRTMLLALSAALGVLLALAAAGLVAQQLRRPLQRLRDSALRLRDGDYREPVPAVGDDETRELALSLERMRVGIAAREDRIALLAYEDPVTGLPNRARLVERLQADRDAARRDGNPLALLHVNLSRFRQVNDMLGHAAGDAVLRQAGSRISRVLRPADSVARIGGDEFGVALPGADADEARSLARAVLRALRDPLDIDGQPVDLNASIGIALHPEHADDVATLLRNADIAMNAAQRNRVALALYDPSHEVARREHLSLLGELRQAVEQSQLRAYYQPKIDLATGEATGAEALVRWRHPQRGMIPPAGFIPFAEQSGHVRILTRWMLAVTLRQVGAWAAAGLPLRIAVNISAADLVSPDLPTFVADLIAAHAVPPGRVCLEITEGTLIDDPQAALQAVKELAAVGVRLAIDDFGTGFSSLAYLKQLPVHELKIDASFVRAIITSERDASIVRSIIDLAHSLGLTVVAEGVEDIATLERLRAMGCDQAQGYLIARPMRRAGLESWVRERARRRGRAARVAPAASLDVGEPADAPEPPDQPDEPTLLTQLTPLTPATPLMQPMQDPPSAPPRRP